jgi:hypothetical protein
MLLLTIGGLMAFGVGVVVLGRPENSQFGSKMAPDEQGKSPAKKTERPAEPSGFIHTPELVPGDSLDKATRLYGRPTESTLNVRTWEMRKFELSVEVDRARRITSVYVSAVGPPVVTPDGIALGKSTLAEVRKILSGRILPERETLVMEDGMWELDEAVRPSATESPWLIYYTWFLNENIQSDEKILHRLGPTPTADVFTGVAVRGYSTKSATSVSDP